jgi:hypothetical protein
VNLHARPAIARRPSGHLANEFQPFLFFFRKNARIRMQRTLRLAMHMASEGFDAALPVPEK